MWITASLAAAGGTKEPWRVDQLSAAGACLLLRRIAKLPG